MYDYQIEGAEWLSNKNYALLAHEMGLGKTVMAIRGLERIHANKALIICPSVARVNWLREIEMWSTRRAVVMTKISDLPPKDCDVICSFDYVTENFERLQDYNFDFLIVDEAHFLKNHDAKRAKAIMGVKGIIRRCQRTWLLTGTPAPNHPG
jgi:SNF2 family DNA or RNA helicase